MISSQLGTEARPRFFCTVRRCGGSASPLVRGGLGALGAAAGWPRARRARRRLPGRPPPAVRGRRRRGSRRGRPRAGCRWSPRRRRGARGPPGRPPVVRLVVRLGDQLDRVDAQRQLVAARLVAGHRAEQPAALVEVVAHRRDPRRRGDDLADQPPGVLVVEHDVVAGGVEDVRRGALARRGGEASGERPPAVVAAPGVPLDAVGVGVERAQVGGDRLAEGARTALAAGAAHGRALGALRDVLALGEHRARVDQDLVDAGLRRLGDRLGRLTGPDPGLDVTGTKHTVHLFLQLAGTGGGADRGPECRRDVEGELGALVVDQRQTPSVVARSGEREVGHRSASCGSFGGACGSGEPTPAGRAEVRQHAARPSNLVARLGR